MNKNLINEIVDLTAQLISIPSTHSSPVDLDRCATFITDWLDSHNIPSSRFDSNGIPSISVMPGDQLSAPLLINAHFDVVEAENPDLFQPKISNGKLHGRGAIDDKYGIALSLVLFREHLHGLMERGKEQTDMVFGLIFTGDEELGGQNGMAPLARQLTSDFFVVLDGGHPDLIVTKEKGILLIELTATGKSAHAARPWLGTNGFDLLIDNYLRLKEMFNISSDDHWHKTMVLSQCQAGTSSTNMVPQQAKATLDIRYTENDDVEEIIDEITTLLTCSHRILAKEPVFCSGSSPYFEVLKGVAQNSRFTCAHGASDARHLARQGIPGVIWGADGEMTQHTESEYLKIESLSPLYQKLSEFIVSIEKNVAATRQKEQFTTLKN